MSFLQAHAAVNLALASVLWVVQLVIYPAFKSIAAEQFGDWHRNYTAQITWVVAPLILIQTAGVAGRLAFLERADALWWTELTLTAFAWGTTAFVSVPLHALLQKKRCEKSMRLLVSTNWIRTLAWSGTAICSWKAAGN